MKAVYSNHEHATEWNYHALPARKGIITEETNFKAIQGKNKTFVFRITTYYFSNESFAPLSTSLSRE